MGAEPPVPSPGIEPLRPPRQDEARAVPRQPPPAHGQALDPGTVLRPTRFVAGLPGLAPSPVGVQLCDGRRTLAEIARAAGIEVGLAAELLAALYAQGLVCEVGEGPVPAPLFLEHLRGLCLWLRRDLLAARPGLDTAFAGGAYSRRLAVGYLVEVTHVIRGAASHIAAAIALARDEQLQSLLSAYLADEHWHGSWMERSLAAAGLSEHDRARALPLPATLATLNSWRQAGRTDLLLYGGLIAITEAGTDEGAQIEALFRQTVTQGILPEGAWRPYFEHAFGDASADHVDLSRALFAGAGQLSPARRDALRRGLLLHAQGLVQMEHAILDFYSATEGPPVHALCWSQD